MKILILFAFASLACFGATVVGTISDSACAASHGKMMAEHKNLKTDRDCTLACVKAGGQYVLFSDGKIYTISNQEVKDLATFAGETVKVTGDLKGTTLTVSKISKN